MSIIKTESKKIMIKQIKRIISALAAVMLMATFAGCGSDEDVQPKMNIDYGKRADGSTYVLYDGEAQEFFGVAEGKENVVDVTVKKESGELRIIIHKENNPDAVIYDGHDFPSEHFAVTVKESGRYRILVQAKSFVGSYNFSYDMMQ